MFENVVESSDLRTTMSSILPVEEKQPKPSERMRTENHIFININI